MKSKAYFIAGAILLGFGIGASLLAAAFFANIGFFRVFSAQRFGFRIIVLMITSLSAAVILLKNYDFSYKKDFGWLIGLIVVGVLLFGLLLSRTPINLKVKKVPQFRSLYENGQLPVSVQKRLMIITPKPALELFQPKQQEQLQQSEQPKEQQKLPNEPLEPQQDQEPQQHQEQEPQQNRRMLRPDKR